MSNLRSIRSLINAPAVPPLTCSHLSMPVISLRASPRRQFNCPYLHITKDGDHGARFQPDTPALHVSAFTCRTVALSRLPPLSYKGPKDVRMDPWCPRSPLYRAQVYLGPIWLSISCSTSSSSLLTQRFLRASLKQRLRSPYPRFPQCLPYASAAPAELQPATKCRLL